MRVLLTVLVALAAAGCSTPCEELAQEICSCEPTRSARTACEQRAAEVESRGELTDADQEYCEQKLPDCHCEALETAAGKRACGLTPDA